MSSKARPAPRGLGRGVLWTVALLFAGSALIRLAEAASDLPVPVVVANEDAGASERDETLAMLLEEIGQRRAELDDRELALEARMAELKDAETRLSDGLRALNEAREDLAARMAFAESAAEEDLARLTKLYETMKPKDAAALFAEMAPEFAAGFLSRMKTDAAAAVLAGLSPDVATEISLILAGRNVQANGPLQPAVNEPVSQ